MSYTEGILNYINNLIPEEIMDFVAKSKVKTEEANPTRSLMSPKNKKGNVTNAYLGDQEGFEERFTNIDRAWKRMRLETDSLDSDIDKAVKQVTSMEGTEVDEFIGRLAQSESGGDWSIVNKEGYTGRLQFGKARISDYNKANKTKITLAQFRESPELQMKVEKWHIKDIDRAYNNNKKAQERMSRDAFRAVAHLGGINGAYKYVQTALLPIGNPKKYNPMDSNKTLLSDYHYKFDNWGA